MILQVGLLSTLLTGASASLSLGVASVDINKMGFCLALGFSDLRKYVCDYMASPILLLCTCGIST